MRFNLNDGALRAGTASLIALSLVSVLGLAACADGGQADARSPQIVATTGHVHDALEALCEGLPIELSVLCGPGVDPHSYSASTKDVVAIQDAEAVIFNGLHLEARLADLLERDNISSKAWSMGSAFPAEHRLDWIEDGAIDEEAPFDPHIWNHLPGWGESVKALSAHLGEVFPEHAETLRTNADAYVAEIMAADAWAKTALEAIPEARRYLVSGHDAFNYFARRYGMTTFSVLGVGNDPEADLATMASVADLVTEHRIPVIFIESITNPKVASALSEACGARDWTVRIADAPLYSDDLGDAAPVDSYLGAFRHNVETIVDGLGEGL